MEYKIVYKITTDEIREGVNKGLNGIAHAINMLGCANIKNNNVKIVATIQGPATSIILSDETYFKNNTKKQYDYPILTVRDRSSSNWEKVKFYLNYFNNLKKPIYFGKNNYFFKKKSIFEKVKYQFSKLK